MKCLRCDGTGIDPQAAVWDDPNLCDCTECAFGETDFKTWLRQLWDIVVWKLFRV